MNRSPRQGDASSWVSSAGYDRARETLCEAARQQICEGGARSMSMRGLAASLGISPMTAYRYYADREELLRAVKVIVAAQLADELRSAIGQRAVPGDRLRGAAVAYLEYAVAHEHEYRLMFDEWIGDIAASDGMPNQGANWELLTELLRDMAPKAGAGELAGRAHLVWAAIHGLAMLHLSGRSRLAPPIAVTARIQLDLILGLAGEEL